MAESSIPFPTPDGDVDLATRVEDGKHRQHVVNALRIIGSAVVVTDGAQAVYTAGDVIGSPVYAGRIPSSVFEVLNAAIFDFAGAAPVFDVMLVALSATPDGDPPTAAPTVPADGAPFTDDGSISGAAVVFAASDFDAVPYGPASVLALGPGRRFLLLSGESSPGGESLLDVYAVFIAAETVAVADFSAGLLFRFFARQEPTAFLDTTYAP